MTSNVISQTKQKYHSITKKVESFENKIEIWSKQKVDMIDKLLKEQNNFVTKGDEHLQLLKKKHQEICQNILQLENTLKQELSKEDELKRTITNLKVLEKENCTQIPLLVQEMNKLKIQVEKTEKMVQNEQTIRNETKERLISSSQNIQRYLGLHFEQIPQNNFLRICFTNIDRQNPLKIYSFCVRTQNSKYEVGLFDPPIQVDVKLIDQLNRDNNFQKFVVEIRKCFVNYQSK